MTEKQREPVTVSTGLLSASEFNQLEADVQRTIETDTQRLLDRYGAAWVTRERARLRDELAFAYGI